MVPISFTRSPVSAGLQSLKSSREFPGVLRAVTRASNGHFGDYLSISFTAKSARSDFVGIIKPEQFEDLVRDMMRVDANATVQAFGRVLQEVNVPNLETPELQETA
jgi:hypothetical protein